MIDKGKVTDVFCHFSFRRPKGEDYGIFAVAMYLDYDGKKYLGHTVKAEKLWDNHQYITGAQSLKHALQAIFEVQNQLINNGIKNVYLVTDNSTLAKWMIDSKKNQMAKIYMPLAWKEYRPHEKKEIVINVGLAKVRKSEKSYKYCKIENVENGIPNMEKEVETQKVYKIDIADTGYKSILDIIEEEKPKIEGVEMM